MFRQRLFKYLKQWLFLDYENKEIRKITEVVDEFLKKILTEVENQNDITILKKISTGSMAEKTKIWPLRPEGSRAQLEFDRLVIVKPKLTYKRTCNNGCNGYMEILDEETGSKLKHSQLTDQFRDQLYEAIKKVCPCCELKRVLVTFADGSNGEIRELTCSSDDVNHNGCCLKTKYGTLRFTRYLSEDEHHIHFVWVSEKSTINAPYLRQNDNRMTNETLKNISIEIDILPGFYLNFENKNQYLVPKDCEKNHSTCWKISHCTEEIEMLQYSHRETYMAMKFLCDLILSNDYNLEEDQFMQITALTSYRIKLSVLNHIKTCCEEGDSCLSQTFRYFANCIENSKISHWQENYQLSVDFLDNFRGSVFILYLNDLIAKQYDRLESYKFKDSRTDKSVVLEEVIGKQLSEIAKETTMQSDDNHMLKFFDEVRSAALKLLHSSGTERDVIVM